MTIQATKFTTAADAINAAKEEAGVAVRYQGQNLVMAVEDADAIERSGQHFAYLGFASNRDGRQVVVTVPIN